MEAASQGMACLRPQQQQNNKDAAQMAHQYKIHLQKADRSGSSN